MFQLAVLALLTLLLYFSLKRILSQGLSATLINYERLKSEYEKRESENAQLKNDNAGLEKSAQETIALYDITKDICRTLDEKRVLELFKEKLGRYIPKGNCQFIEAGADISSHKDCSVFPLNIERQLIGYLLACDINTEDKEKFHILANQYLSVIKRVLLYQKIQELTITDTLTQVFNRRYFLLRFSEELKRSQKFNFDLSFLMIDIDNFKECNDHYGHMVGDVILKEATRTIKETVRQIDFIGRYGGEEISIVLVETDKEQARQAAERIRQAIEAKLIAAYDEKVKVTISVGVSTFPEDGIEEQALIDKADEALYKAKEAGRNKVVVY